MRMSDNLYVRPKKAEYQKVTGVKETPELKKKVEAELKVEVKTPVKAEAKAAIEDNVIEVKSEPDKAPEVEKDSDSETSSL